jgi:hypothetical protein
MLAAYQACLHTWPLPVAPPHDFCASCVFLSGSSVLCLRLPWLLAGCHRMCLLPDWELLLLLSEFVFWLHAKWCNMLQQDGM